VPSLATNPPPSHKDRPNKTPAKVHVVQKKGKKQQPKEEWCKRIPQKNRQNPPPTIYLHHKRCPHGVRGVSGVTTSGPKKKQEREGPPKNMRKKIHGAAVCSFRGCVSICICLTYEPWGWKWTQCLPSPKECARMKYEVF